MISIPRNSNDLMVAIVAGFQSDLEAFVTIESHES